MSELLKSIDERTKLAGTNKLEILLFSLGKDDRTDRTEIFGINVFKVREVIRPPEITSAPDMPDSVEGMVSLRGMLVPVVDLAKFTGIRRETEPKIMIVTEYNGHTQGFLVESVDTILRLNWSQMKVPPEMLNTQMGGLVTAVTELPGNRLVMVMDVERILSETTKYDDEAIFSSIRSVEGLENKLVLYADDSAVARRQIERTLDALGVRHMGAVNGLQAEQELDKIAHNARLAGKKAKDFLSMVITDVEMPEIDGYILCKYIKSDPRFEGIPVAMHSSLSSGQNQQLGKMVGADAYIPKFEPQKLANTVTSILLGKPLVDEKSEDEDS